MCVVYSRYEKVYVLRVGVCNLCVNHAYYIFLNLLTNYIYKYIVIENKTNLIGFCTKMFETTLNSVK